jgi:hypothetical protein
MEIKGIFKWIALVLAGLLIFCCLGGLFISVVSKGDQQAELQTTSLPPQETPLSPSEPQVTVVVVEATQDTAQSAAPTQDLRPSQTPWVIVVTATGQSAALQASEMQPTPVPPIQGGAPVNDFQALVAYAETIKPYLDEGLAAAERDGKILEASEDNPEALCGGYLVPHPVLVTDAATMDRIVRQLNGISPPPEAADAVHKPLTESTRLWGEALDNINRSCQSTKPGEQGVMRLSALVELGGALLNFKVASDNYWALLLTNGIEILTGTPITP